MSFPIDAACRRFPAPGRRNAETARVHLDGPLGGRVCPATIG